MDFPQSLARMEGGLILLFCRYFQYRFVKLRTLPLVSSPEGFPHKLDLRLHQLLRGLPVSSSSAMGQSLLPPQTLALRIADLFASSVYVAVSSNVGYSVSAFDSSSSVESPIDFFSTL